MPPTRSPEPMITPLEPRTLLAADPIAPDHDLWVVVPGEVVVDGQLNDAAWSSAFEVTRAQAFRSGERVTLRMLAGVTGLYVAWDVRDAHLWADGRGGGEAERWEIETDDSMALYVDPDNSRHEYFQADDIGFGVNLGNPDDPRSGSGVIRLDKHFLGDGAGSGTDVNYGILPDGLTWATVLDGTVNDNSDRDTGWTTEMLLPWSAIGLSGRPESGDTVGMNFDVIFDNEGGERDMTDHRSLDDRWDVPVFIDDHLQGEHSSYHATQAGMHGPVNFAEVMFIDPADAPTPDAITDLEVVRATGYSAEIAFTAPEGVADEGGHASSYEIRLSSAAITDETSWARAQRVSNAFTPRLAGLAESLVIPGLSPSTIYHVSVRAVNAAGNLGPIPVSASFSTQSTSADVSQGERVIVSPMGRTLMHENGEPFVAVGDHLGLSWHYTRALYPGLVWDSSAQMYHNFNVIPSYEGPAGPYFDELEAQGVTVMRVFLEQFGATTPPSLPTGTYWLEYPAGTYNLEMRQFMLNVLQEASEHGIHVIFSPFETFGYDEYFATEFAWSEENGGPLDDINNFYQDADVRALAENRMSTLISWVQSPSFAPYAHALLGWEPLNEWDSYEWTLNREGDADPGRETEFRRRAQWITSMAEFIRERDPQRLVVNSSTALDPRGPIARAMFNSRAFDVLAPHLYTNASEEPINNPDSDTSIRPAIEQANLTAFWLTHDLSRRPMFSGEWGLTRADWPGGVPGYTTSYTQAEDEAIFRTVLWSGVASGQAASPMRIATDELVYNGAILTDAMRDVELAMANFLSDDGLELDLAHLSFDPLVGDVFASNPADHELLAFGVSDGEQGIAYVLHDTRATAGVVTGATLTIRGMRPDIVIDAEFWSTADGADAPLASMEAVFVSDGTLSLDLPSFTQDIAVKFRARTPETLAQTVNGAAYGDDLVTFHLDAGAQPVARIVDSMTGAVTEVDVAAAARFTGRVIDMHPLLWGGAMNLALTDENHHLWFMSCTDWTAGAWSAVDLTALIGGGGMTGDLTHYSPSWGAIHLAGLDARGHAINYWFAPGSTTTWIFSDLTALFDGPLMSGGLTGYVTSWDGLNLAGLNSDGETIVYWWAPDVEQLFGSNSWQTINMTESFAGPEFVGRLDAYVTPWGGLNIAGRTSAGEIYTYWWVPGFSGWVVSSISDAASAPAFAEGTEVVVSGDGGINIFGLDGAGDLQVLRWTPTTLAWDHTDVSSASSGLSVDFPVATAAVGDAILAAGWTDDDEDDHELALFVFAISGDQWSGGGEV